MSNELNFLAAHAAYVAAVAARESYRMDIADPYTWARRAASGVDAAVDRALANMLAAASEVAR